MENGAIVVSWADFWREIQVALTFLETTFFSLLFRPYGQIQIALLVGIFIVAHLLARVFEPRFEAWLRNLETTRGRLRFLAVLLRRLRLAFFITGTWLVFLVMRAFTWPSRSYLIGVVGAIATVWLTVTLIARLVRNPLARKALTYTVCIVVALQILGMLPIAVKVLESAAVTVGDLRVSLLLVVKTVFVVALLFWIASLVSSATERRLQRVEDLSPSMRVLTAKLIRIVLFAIALMIALQSIGFNLTSLTVFSGAVGIGVGFGLQKVVSNLVSGMILLLDKSIKPGDVIEVGDTFGWIQTLSGRYVSVVTRDGREYLIPNEDLITSQVINWSHTNPRVRLEVEFGVSYDADPHEIRSIAIEAAGVAKRVLPDPKPVCHLVAYGASSIDFVLRFWIADPNAGVVNIKGEILLALWDALKANDIEIPYPRRDVQLRGPVRVEIEPGAETRDAANVRPPSGS